MDDVKPFQLTDLKTTEFANCPIKSGEIFRHNRGQYSFMCFHCGFIIENFAEIINHCDSHYQDETFNETEFVVCPELDTKVKVNLLLSPQPDILDAACEFVVQTEIDAEVKVITPQPDVTETAIVSNEPSSMILLEPEPLRSSSIRKRRKKRSNILVGFNGLENCPLCGVWCNTYEDHMVQEHRLKNFTRGRRIFQCYICKYVTKSEYSLKHHLLCRHTNTCYQCAMDPPVRNSLQPRRHKCQFCKEWYKNHAEFRVHFKEAHDKDADTFYSKRKNCNAFTCYVCEREFRLRGYLYSHMKLHDDKYLQHTCPTCGKTFRTFGVLTQHLKKHDDKIYQCEQCEKQFKTHERLRIHQQCHQTELKYKCPHCPKAFTLIKYLTVHKMGHDNQKRYQCKFCDARFNFQSGRRAHEKSQHNAL